MGLQEKAAAKLSVTRREIWAFSRSQACKHLLEPNGGKWGAGKQMNSGGEVGWGRWKPPQAFLMYCIKNDSKVSKVQFLSVHSSPICSLLHVHRVETGRSSKKVFLSAQPGKMDELRSQLDKFHRWVLASFNQPKKMQLFRSRNLNHQPFDHQFTAHSTQPMAAFFSDLNIILKNIIQSIIHLRKISVV